MTGKALPYFSCSEAPKDTLYIKLGFTLSGAIFIYGLAGIIASICAFHHADMEAE